MSGHSKWSTIKRQKGANDAKRGQIFTKLSKAITVAVQQGGGSPDPESNFKLRLAIEAARTANMPKDNIERAIQRASGKSAETLEEVTYEGFGPGGFSVIVEGLTDNKVRTVAEVKNIFNKNGGNMGAQGSVAYQFEQRGSIAITKGTNTLDDVFMLAVEHGAEDIEEIEDEILVYTKPDDLTKVKDALTTEGLAVKNIELLYRPIVITSITDTSSAQTALDFLDKLESLDDVQKVYANIDIPDKVLG